MTDPQAEPDIRTPGRALSAYLLGGLGFDAFLALQRRLMYDVAGDATAAMIRNGTYNLQRRLMYDVAGDRTAAVVVCEHPPGITVGREGSRLHVRPEPAELQSREWPVRWVGRGGGVMLHLPGQVACYPVLPLADLGLTAAGYLQALQGVVVDLLRDYDIVGEPDADRPGVRANGRRVAHVGVAVRGGVTGYGLVLNVNPDPDPFRLVWCDGDPTPMTSVQRESPARVRVPAVRQRLVELLAARFGFDRVSVFHTHPGFFPAPTRHATTTGTR